MKYLDEAHCAIQAVCCVYYDPDYVYYDEARYRFNYDTQTLYLCPLSAQQWGVTDTFRETLFVGATALDAVTEFCTTHTRVKT